MPFTITRRKLTAAALSLFTLAALGAANALAAEDLADKIARTGELRIGMKASIRRLPTTMPPGNLPGPTLNSGGNLPKSLASNRSLRKRPGAGLTSTDHVRPETIGDLSYGVSAGLRFITGEMFSSTLS